MHRSRSDFHAEITEKIVALIEAGTIPWRPGWGSVAPLTLPRNPFTGKSYGGINVVVLWAEAMRQGYLEPAWGTFKQIATAGGSVRRGEKGTRVVFFKTLEVQPEGGGDSKAVSVPRTFTVFNTAQCQGLENAPPLQRSTYAPAERDDLVRAMPSAIGVEVRQRGDRAYYSQPDDHIGMPPSHLFHSIENHLATMAHECIHATGHKDRLARVERCARFGSEAYAFEELVAELGASFLAAEYSFCSDLQNHASYIESWLKVLRGDRRAIFKAAAEATKAACYIRERLPKCTRSVHPRAASVRLPQGGVPESASASVPAG